MTVIGQPPSPVLRDLHTRAERNGARYRAWLRDHPAAAEALQADLLELGQAAFDDASVELWNVAQGSATWH